MSIDRQKLRWNGWGWVDAPDTLGERAPAVWEWMGKTLGLHPLPFTPAKPLSEITLPPIRVVAPDLLASLSGLLAPERVKTDDFERAFHARGKSYHDLLHLRAGNLDTAPDAVAYPVSTEECLAVVQFAAAENIALIPFGGGSSVVGGVTGLAAPGQRGVISLDMTLMDQVLEIDEEALTARVQAGVYGPQLENALQARGFTLGHYPQSFEFSTLGGWIAPRGAGHQSNKYGKAEHWLVGATLATPKGLWQTESFPGSAAGPQMRDIVAGSEGILGVIIEATVKIHPLPEVKDYRGYLFMDFASGVAAAREMMQASVQTAMIRLSDENETRFYTALTLGGQEPDPSVRFCAMLIGLEGSQSEVAHALSESRAIVEKHAGIHMGESLGENWYKGRFETPYLRDPMMDRGLGVDTLETATRWSNLLRLHDITTEALSCALDAQAAFPKARGIVMSHLSHAYPDGASLYFTFAFPRAPERAVEQWLAIKRAVSDAIVANGGTISHHHGIGIDHLPWIQAEKGDHGISALKALKRELDPASIFNPGKLIP